MTLPVEDVGMVLEAGRTLACRWLTHCSLGTEADGVYVTVDLGGFRVLVAGKLQCYLHAVEVAWME
jgi:hypothetical protein